jgi:CDP-diacylglycerol--glycerol-3-phosphate 3-phosphatidyltransferase
VSDFAIGVLPWAIVLSALLVYAVRVMITGRARSARADRDGGSLLLSLHLVEFAMWFLSPIATFVVRIGGTPDGVTWFSLIPGMGAGVALAAGRFGLATLLGTVAAFCDSIDGMVARMRNMGSEAGETLDAIADRYTESAFLVGLILYYRDSLLICAIVALALVGAFMVSYTSAKAEAQHIDPPRGLMRRSERATYMLVGVGLTVFTRALVAPTSSVWLREAPVLVAVAAIALVSNLSTFIRVSHIRRALRGEVKV